MPSVFRHVRIVTPDDICERDLLIDDSGTITSFIDPASPVPDGTTAIDGGGCYAFPGMIDALTHGYGPYLYSDAESAAIADNSGALPKHGVTAFVPSILAKTEADLLPLLQKLAGCDKGSGARCLGIHSEGPCFAAPGAHKPENLTIPSAALAEHMLEAAAGQLKFVTLAPELNGAAEFMQVLRDAGVGLHLGHSRAQPEDVRCYADRGISGVTHIFDVMIPGESTEDGLFPLSLPDALMAEPRICLGLICDGVHADPIQVQLLAQLPADRLFLETDSVKFTGLPPGRFLLDVDLWATTTEGRGARLDNGGLAGSTLTSDQALRNLITFTGMSLSRASIATSLNPARLAGVDDRLGSLVPGKQADVVLLDDDLNVQATYVSGQCVTA